MNRKPALCALGAAAGALLAAPAEAAVSAEAAYAFNSFSFLVCGALVTIAAAIVRYAIRVTIGLRVDEDFESLGFGQGSRTV